MWLILTETHDPCGRWLAEGLSPRTKSPVVHLTADDLTRTRTWEHRVDSRRAVSGLRLADGREINSAEVSGMINRLIRPPGTFLEKVRAADRAYAAQEWAALCVSWLHSFPGPILNPASPGGLSGPYRHPLEWMRLAQGAGFQTASPWFSSSQTPATYFSPPAPAPGEASLWVVGHQVIASPGCTPDDATLQAARRLAMLAGSPLVELRIVGDRSSWEFRSANPWPDLRPAGESLLDAVADTLTEKPQPAELALAR